MGAEILRTVREITKSTSYAASNSFLFYPRQRPGNEEYIFVKR